MYDEKQIDALNRYVPPLLKRFVARAPIRTYTYSKGIRAAKPYNAFVYMDVDAVPNVTNVPLDRPDLYALFIDANRQFWMKHPAVGVSRQRFGGPPPGIWAFTIDSPDISLDGSVPVGEPPVSLDVSHNLNDRPARPVVQSLTFEARTGSAGETVSIIERNPSQDAVFRFDTKHEEASTARHIFDDRPARCTTAASSTERPYASRNHSLVPVEPSCSVYRISTTGPRVRIARQHRYTRAKHIVPNPDNP